MLDEDELRELCKQQMFYKQQEKDAVLKRAEIEARIIEMLGIDKSVHTDLEFSNYKIDIKPSKTDKVNNDILEYIVKQNDLKPEFKKGFKISYSLNKPEFKKLGDNVQKMFLTAIETKVNRPTFSITNLK